MIDYSPFFRQPTILIIASVENGKMIEPQEIPKQLFIMKKSYSLIGLTLFSAGHFILKVFNGENFYDYDNLKKVNGVLNNEKKEKEISYAFYVKD